MLRTRFDLPIDASIASAWGLWRQSVMSEKSAHGVGIRRVWQALRPGTSNHLNIYITGDGYYEMASFSGEHADALEAAMEGRLIDSSHPTRHSTPPEAWRVFAMPHPWRLLIASPDGSKVERVLTLEKP